MFLLKNDRFNYNKIATNYQKKNSLVKNKNKINLHTHTHSLTPPHTYTNSLTTLYTSKCWMS